MKKKSLILTVLTTLGFTASTMAQNVPSYVPTNGLVGWWPFNGNANDESGFGNNGVVNGATSTQDRIGNFNQAYSFDGINDIITCNGGNVYVDDTITFSFWINRFNNATQVPENVVSMGNSSGVRWGFEASQNRLCLSNGSGCLGAGPGLNLGISLNVWHNITFLVLGSDQYIYVDGIQVGIAPGNAILTSLSCPNTNLFFGLNLWGTKYFNGKLDDIGIWNRALAQQEITALYNGCQLSVNTQPANQTINTNNSVQIIVSSSDPSATYQWQTDLGVGFQNLNSVGQYSGTTNDTLTVSNITMSNNNQSFRCIINSGSCSDTSNVAVLTVVNNVGIHEFAQDNLFSVYPNPAQTLINVKADSKLVGESYSVIDNTGRVVSSGKIVAEITSIELGNLSNGIYLFNVGNNLKQQFKILKH